MDLCFLKVNQLAGLMILGLIMAEESEKTELEGSCERRVVRLDGVMNVVDELWDGETQLLLGNGFNEIHCKLV